MSSIASRRDGNARGAAPGAYSRSCPRRANAGASNRPSSSLISVSVLVNRAGLVGFVHGRSGGRRNRSGQDRQRSGGLGERGQGVEAAAVVPESAARAELPGSGRPTPSRPPAGRPRRACRRARRRGPGQVGEVAVGLRDAQAGDDAAGDQGPVDRVGPLPGIDARGGAGSGGPWPSCADRTGSIGKARSARTRLAVSGPTRYRAKSIAASRRLPGGRTPDPRRASRRRTAGSSDRSGAGASSHALRAGS